jgi:hypothetical protein
MGRCGESLKYLNANHQVEWCDCFLNPVETQQSLVTNICDDFKPVCKWFYQGANDAAGAISAGYPLSRSNGCAVDPPEQVFTEGMVACGGSMPWSGAASLCSGDYTLCTADQWVSNRGSAAPVNNYWLQDNLNLQVSSGDHSGDCDAVDAPAGAACGAVPMHVCGAANDAYGNVCSGWMRCGFNDHSVQFIGGCGGVENAGALCCLKQNQNACSSLATGGQSFAPGMAGCAGHVAFADRATLCAGGCNVCTAKQWVKNRGGAHPSHDYWVQEALNWSGSGTGAGHCGAWDDGSNNTTCSASPMRVCVPSSGGGAVDPEGNVCNWDSCGLDSTSTDSDFGGCSGNPTAGTLCCCGG